MKRIRFKNFAGRRHKSLPLICRASARPAGSSVWIIHFLTMRGQGTPCLHLSTSALSGLRRRRQGGAPNEKWRSSNNQAQPPAAGHGPAYPPPVVTAASLKPMFSKAGGLVPIESPHHSPISPKKPRHCDRITIGR
jgi:hypothetical protein